MDATTLEVRSTKRLRKSVPSQNFEENLLMHTQQIANDFNNFNEPAQFIHPTFSGQHEFPSRRRVESLLAFPIGQDALAWSSEFQSTYSKPADLSNARAPQSYSANRSTGSSQHVSTSQGYRRVEQDACFMSASMSRRLKPIAKAFQWETNSKLLPDQHQVSTFKQQVLDDVDWEAMFQSLEPALKGPDTDILEAKQAAADHQEADVAEQRIDDVYTRDQFFDTQPITNYNFQDTNPFRHTSDPFEEGIQILKNDGNLSFAALAFEAACQMNQMHLEAWRMLGSVQSENENESAAIKALEQACELEPDDLDILIKLAVSYTNEGFEDRAYECLGQWLSTKYPHIQINEANADAQLPEERHTYERIKEAFIQAAQYSSTSESIDPDVQVGLGVLLFSDENYEMGADCFASAIHATTPGATKRRLSIAFTMESVRSLLGKHGEI